MAVGPVIKKRGCSVTKDIKRFFKFEFFPDLGRKKIIKKIKYIFLECRKKNNFMFWGFT